MFEITLDSKTKEMFNNKSSKKEKISLPQGTQPWRKKRKKKNNNSKFI